MSKTRTKAPATPVPQNATEANALLAVIGRQGRHLEMMETSLNNALNDVKSTSDERTAPVAKSLKENLKALKAYAEANRSTLLRGRTKSVKWPAGVIGWRKRPPSIQVRRGLKVGELVEVIRGMGRKFQKLLTVKHSLDKETMLKHPTLIEEIDGASIEDDAEDFFIEPFGAELNNTEEPDT